MIIHEEGKCPACNKRLDAATPIEDESHRPEDGSFGICFGCGAILIYTIPPDGRLTLQLAPYEALEKFKDEAPEMYARMVFFSMKTKNKEKMN